MSERVKPFPLFTKIAEAQRLARQHALTDCERDDPKFVLPAKINPQNPQEMRAAANYDFALNRQMDLKLSYLKHKYLNEIPSQFHPSTLITYF
jgi:hypothetical protein